MGKAQVLGEFQALAHPGLPPHLHFTNLPLASLHGPFFTVTFVTLAAGAGAGLAAALVVVFVVVFTAAPGHLAKWPLASRQGAAWAMPGTARASGRAASRATSERVNCRMRASFPVIIGPDGATAPALYVFRADYVIVR